MAKDKASQKDQAIKVGFYDDSLKSPQGVPCGGLHSYLKHGLKEEMAKREMFDYPRCKVVEQECYQGGYTFKMGREKKDE